MIFVSFTLFFQNFASYNWAKHLPVTKQFAKLRNRITITGYLKNTKQIIRFPNFENQLTRYLKAV